MERRVGIAHQSASSVSLRVLRGETTRRGFTLIDLLVAITIIGILAAISFGALGAARQSVRADKTRLTITKLHGILMAKYDSYRTRRIPMDLRQYVWAHSPLNPSCPAAEQYYNPGQTNWPREIARARVNAIRDLMRLEMPDRWSDVTRDLTDPDERIVLSQRPAASLRYKRIYDAALAAAAGDSTKLSNHAAAECLYMIVMAIPEAAEQFHESEIGDVDHDGLPEFVDSWGMPIRFLRWPAGFLAVNQADTDLQDGVAPDPFDPMRVRAGDYALFPLVYSAGPDELYDIDIGKNSDDTVYAYTRDTEGNLDPYVADGAGYLIGQPRNVNDPANLHHYDNIHNQREE